MLILILDAKTALQGAREGLTLCLKTVIPSLFPFFVLSILLTSSLLGSSIPLLRPLGWLCGLPKGAESLLIPAFLGGYPVGAQSVAEACRSGQLSKAQTQRLLAFCNNAGPSFILGVVGLGCFQSLRVGAILYTIHALSAGLVGMLLRGSCRSRPGGFHPQPPPEKILPAFIRSVQESAAAMLRVCGFVVFALVAQTLLTDLTGLAHPAFLGFIELTVGVTRLGSGKRDFVWAAAMLGWGGLSVHGQTAAVLSGTELKMGRYFLGKALQAVLSAALAYVIGNGIAR